MELREFASQILFATTLKEKLLCPAAITDEKPGPPLATPAVPGRPAELRFKASGTARDHFPGIRRLEQAAERGKLLHYFANHELLATELMALVLLRFPDAPAAFRKGILQTLKDEQEHTRLYLERMEECGIHFGDLPVSGYFWRSVSTMENPMDYVSSLCLTFEQANLDFARHFARGFEKIGDHATARLLEKIYRDEIGHVAYGLKWFRRWKNPDDSDWDAFCRQLRFPLSPQRAKGITLNVAGRRAAGLDPQFIAALDVFSQSRGRTPNVFVFNLFAEACIARGRSFNPTRHQAQLRCDLENLPQFLCRQDDVVLVEHRPSMEFLGGVKQAGFALPEFMEFKAINGLRDRKLGRLRPWAWSSDSVELFQPFFGQLTAEKRIADDSFNPRVARLYSKAWSAALLKKILRSRRGDEALTSKSGISQSLLMSDEDWLCTENEVGIAVDSVADAMAAIAAIRRRGHHKIVVKEALGVAGSNAMRLFEPEVLESHRRWLINTLRDGRQLVVEPWLTREQDFSVQLEMTADGLKLCGYTGLLNDANGQFQANTAAPGHHKKIPADVIALFSGPPDIAQRLHQLYADIFASLEKELFQVKYIGPVGIDSFVYRDADRRTRLKPIVEINPRYTMGRVMVELMRRTCPGSHGRFRLVNRAALRVEGCESFPAYAKMLAEQFPLKLEGDPVPRISEGALCLNDSAQAQVCLAVFQVTSGVSGQDGSQKT